MRLLIGIMLMLVAGCAVRAPEGKQLWVPREQAVRPGGQVEGAQVWVPREAPSMTAEQAPAPDDDDPAGPAVAAVPTD